MNSDMSSLSSINEKIIELYDTELTIEQIAKKLSISKTSLSSRIKELGLKREPRLKRKDVSKEEILFLEEQGLSYVEIARKLNIGPGALLVKRKKLGIYNPPQKILEQSAKALKVRMDNKKAGIKSEVTRNFNCLEPYLDEILDLLYSGVSRIEIARRYNVCTHTVSNLLELYEIKVPVIKKLDGKDNQIKKLYNKGLSIKEIAKKLNCSFVTVTTKVKELNLSRELSDIKINSRLAKEEQLIKKMYEKGCSMEEIGKKVKAHPISVGIKIRKMGLTRAHKLADYSRKLSGKDKEIIKMRKKGMTYKEIAKICGVTPNTIMYRLRKLENKRSGNV